MLLKAKAWMDLSARKERGEFVKDKDLRKHRTDVLRLQAQIVEGTQIELDEPLRVDVAEFLAAYEKDPLDPKTIGVPGTFAEALSRIREVFGVA